MLWKIYFIIFCCQYSHKKYIRKTGSACIKSRVGSPQTFDERQARFICMGYKKPRVETSKYFHESVKIIVGYRGRPAEFFNPGSLTKPVDENVNQWVDIFKKAANF